MDDEDNIDPVEFARDFDARLVELSKRRNIDLSLLRGEYPNILSALNNVKNIKNIEKRNAASCLKKLWSGLMTK